MTDADISQRISAEQLHAQRLASVEKLLGEHNEAVTALDRHRERMETRWGLIAAIVGGLGVLAHSWTPTGGPLLDLGTTSRWAVGDLPTSGVDQAEADIADVRVYSDAKSAAWWEARYARGLGHYRGQ